MFKKGKIKQKITFKLATSFSMSLAESDDDGDNVDVSTGIRN